MDDINQELRTLVKETTVYDITIANAIENEAGFEVGTRENLEQVKYNLELRIEQSNDALNILDDERHLFPKMALKTLIDGLFQPTLEQVNKQLEQVF